MTRKKSRPQHRETGNTEFEGYKMFWTSIENDDEMSNLQNPSSAVIIIDDSNDSHDETDNLDEGVSVPLPIKIETTSNANSRDLLSPKESFSTLNDEVVCQEGISTTPRSSSINSSPTESTNRNDLDNQNLLVKNTVFSSCQPNTSIGLSDKSSDLNDNQVVDVAHICGSNFFQNGDQTPIEENVPTYKSISSPIDMLTSTNENTQVNDSISNIDVFNDGETTSNTEVPTSSIVPNDSNSSQLINCAKSTGEAFSLLKALLNSSSSVSKEIEQIPPPSKSAEVVPNPEFLTGAECTKIVPPITIVSDVNPTNPTITSESEQVQISEDVPFMKNPINNNCTVFTTPKEDFPPYTHFMCSKIKLEPCQVPSTLRLMKSELEKLYNNLIAENVLHRKAEAKLTSVEEIKNYESTHKLTPCQVKLLRLPPNVLEEEEISLEDPSLRKWKNSENKLRNEDKFAGLKVWRRGRTLLWRECELLGMDQDSYDKQVKYIQENMLESSSSDVSDDEMPKNSSSDFVTATINGEGKKTCNKTRSSGLTSSEISSATDEYIVEHNTVSDLDKSSVEGKKPSALKITIRKASISKSEDEKIDSDNQGPIPPPNKKTKRTFVTKRTYRRSDVPTSSIVKDVKGDENGVIEKRKVRVEPENVEEDFSVLGCRSHEVENFNLLEKWEIPFEAPTLFRSPRVASRMAQLRNKEAFKAAYVRQPKVPKAMPISKEVKDVVEMLCMKTVEAILSPDSINGSHSSDILKTQAILSGLPKSSKSQEIKKPEACNELSKPKDESHEKIVPVVEKKKPKKKKSFGRTFKSRKRKQKPKPNTIEFHSMVGNPLSSNKNVIDLPPPRKFPLHSTQVPVVSEGPGQSLGALENESPQRHDVFSSPVPFEDSVSKIGSSPKTRGEKETQNLSRNEHEASGEKEINPNEKEDFIVPRVTRAKQPIVEIDLELIEAFCGRRKKKSVSGPTDDLAEKTELLQSKKAAVKTTGKIKRGKRLEQVPTTKSSEMKESTCLNTQVHEISEGPGEIDRILHPHDESTDVQQEFGDASCTLNIEYASIEPKDAVTKQIILDSPMSPTPDDEPLSFVRITRSKKKMSSEGSPYIVITKTEEAVTTKLNGTNDKLGQDKNDNEIATTPSTILSDAEPLIGKKNSIEPDNLPSPFQSPAHSDPVNNSPDIGNLIINCDLPVDFSKKSNSQNVDHGSCSPTSVSITNQLGTLPKKLKLDGVIQNRLAVLDTLNSILATSSNVSKNKKAPRVAKQEKLVDPIIKEGLPESKDNDRKSTPPGEVVFSDEEGNGSELANHISQIIHDQIKDDRAANKENCMNVIDEPELSKGISKNETAEPDKALNDKKKDLIDERTGLPTVLIQRLRDPRIRSKLLSQLECEELNGLTDHQLPKVGSTSTVSTHTKSVTEPKLLPPKINNTIISALNTPTSTDSNPVCTKLIEMTQPSNTTEKLECFLAASIDENTSCSDINVNSKTNDSSDDEEECLKRRKKPRKELDTELVYKSPLEDLQSEARPSYGRTPNRFIRKNPRLQGTDVQNSNWTNRREVRTPGHQVMPGGQQPISWQNDIQWQGYQEQQLPSDLSNVNASMGSSPWTNHWLPNQNYQEAHPVIGGGFGTRFNEPRRNFMEMKLINLAMLPKTTNLESPPIKKIFSFFNHGNPQILRIPSPSYDPNEKERTVTMLDAMGEEMIDILQLPRPTSGLTADYFNELPGNFDLDSLILDPYMQLSYVVDEEVDLGPCGINVFEEDDEREILKKSINVDTPAIAKDSCDNSVGASVAELPIVEHAKTSANIPLTEDTPKIVQQLKPVEDFDLDLVDNPLANILHRLPLLKKQYSMNSSNCPEIKMMSTDQLQSSSIAELKEPPPPPKWITPEKKFESLLLTKETIDSKKTRRSKDSRRRKSRSKSPRRRRKSHSKSPRRRKSRSKSPRRKKSRSKSPRRRKSRSKSPRRRKSRSKSPRRKKSRSKSPSHRYRNRPNRSRSRSLSPCRAAQKPLFNNSEGSCSRSRSRSRDSSWSRSTAEIPKSPTYRWIPPLMAPYLSPKPS